MNALEKITAFVRSYPGADILQTFRVDYTDQIPANGGNPRWGADVGGHLLQSA